MKLIFNFDGELINEFPKKLQERYLEYFSGDEDWSVRYDVAKHSNTPAHILDKLSGDEDWWLRRLIVARSNIPVHILEKLSEDENVYVRESAKANLEKRKAIDKPLE